jgi:hypothetical protein
VHQQNPQFSLSNHLNRPRRFTVLRLSKGTSQSPAVSHRGKIANTLASRFIGSHFAPPATNLSSKNHIAKEPALSVAERAIPQFCTLIFDF